MCHHEQIFLGNIIFVQKWFSESCQGAEHSECIKYCVFPDKSQEKWIFLLSSYFLSFHYSNILFSQWLTSIWLFLGGLYYLCYLLIIKFLKRKKMTESTNFSTSLKGLSKAAYFTIFCTAVTGGTFRVLPKIVFLHSSSHQG